eukprot:CAMPEP_0194120230 /NCGR_PEP_ID=MMETSP0150-20130528/42693_1 /TAXON_ID=122233 /ORGANISM="Chaetoceros debilis, Strain MM31A-1" /LENGTH=66 /DNA_ID=CAMNT_0038812259 /DNA_START=67 /DNA_END=264 /DNA_ORIENTATION=-
MTSLSQRKKWELPVTTEDEMTEEKGMHGDAAGSKIESDHHVHKRRKKSSMPDQGIKEIKKLEIYVD